jgi:hypothetical protein
MSRLVSACAIVALAMLCLTSARAGITPENEIFQARMASRGDTYRGSIAIRNHGRTVTTVKLYQTDYAFSADGHNTFGKPGAVARSNATWLRLSQEQIAIAPGEIGTVEYEVRVPDDARLAGSYWSVVMAQEVEGAEATGDSRPQVQLRQSVRHAIQVITEIGETGRSEVAFRNARLTSEGGKRLLSVDLENTGERWLRTDVWLELHDAQGRNVGRFAGSKRRTLPGTSVRNRIELTAAPPGKYVALLVADGGRNDLFGTQIELDLR